MSEETAAPEVPPEPDWKVVAEIAIQQRDQVHRQLIARVHDLEINLGLTERALRAARERIAELEAAAQDMVRLIEPMP